MFHLTPTARAMLCAGLVSGSLWAATLASPASAAPALVDDSIAPPQGVLSLRGVDFTSPEEVAQLKRRLNRVAMDACVANKGARSPMTSDERACYHTAVRDGLAQIDSRQQQAMRAHTSGLADVRSGGNPAP